MAYLNDFSLFIPEGEENSEGYVALLHGTKYRISIKNNKSVRCDAKVEIDGKHQGTWRLPAYQRAILERPAHDNACFTFYKLGSSESKTIGLDGSDPNLGLIKVTFTPEKPRQYTNVVRTAYTLQSKGITDTQMMGEVTRGGTRGMSAGGTGLSGQSSQQFGQAEEIEPDYNEQTVINLRLVARDGDDTPRPLTRYSNSVPPSIA